ncbi:MULTISPECIES: hypothetical protein [Streptomyces]|uniref:Uncharacterized protein n=1 Tax=Streptomyces doebereineriae TaxID=3075528 RepID=A0ABU2VB09_9ACTN|nr:hypothetical protein [Streptomyces sp. DSM 41640]MDT0482749.1 hypothetical protein [Streptomyces sp. DSM 41640]
MAATRTDLLTDTVQRSPDLVVVCRSAREAGLLCGTCPDRMTDFSGRPYAGAMAAPTCSPTCQARSAGRITGAVQDRGIGTAPALDAANGALARLAEPLLVPAPADAPIEGARAAGDPVPDTPFTHRRRVQGGARSIAPGGRAHVPAAVAVRRRLDTEALEPSLRTTRHPTGGAPVTTGPPEPGRRSGTRPRRIRRPTVQSGPGAALNPPDLDGTRIRTLLEAVGRATGAGTADLPCLGE